MPDLGAAFRSYGAYRYTIVTIANGAQPHTAEAELWWHRPSEEGGKWRYFRRAEAARRVEADFKEWIEGQLEAAAESE